MQKYKNTNTNMNIVKPPNLNTDHMQFMNRAQASIREFKKQTLFYNNIYQH